MGPESADGTAPAPPTTPMPARAAMAPVVPAGAAAVPEPEVVVEVDGSPFTVRVLGVSRAGSPAGPVPLLLLGFYSPEGTDLPVREALVVGRGVADLLDLDLEAAWRGGVAPRTPWARMPLFPEIADRGVKDG